MRRASVCAALLLAGCGGASASHAPQAPLAEEQAPANPPAPSSAPTQPAPERFQSAPPSSTAADSPLDIGGLFGELLAAEALTQGAGTTCDTVCRALQSMVRAAERLCAIASSDAEMETCEQARARVEEAKRRVRAACGVCTETGVP